MALAFGQAATHAPQLMHSAASIARSCIGLATGRVFPSGVPPVFTLTNPPLWMMRSNAVRSTTRSRTTGNAPARHGSTVMSAPSGKLRMCNWQVVAPRSGP
jgi:hypothetical protein